MSIIRMLTDRGIEYCGKVDKHDYQLFLVINDIEPKEASAQTYGICESIHRTILNEFYQVTFCKKIYTSLE